MSGTMEALRNYRGPSVLCYGFRPFFLAAALWAVLAMICWLAMLTGMASLPMRFDPVTWHAHEFLFGYLAAVIAGFVLTAVPNWTGRLPVMGGRLAVLVLLWLAGRVVMALSRALAWPVVLAVDLALVLALVFFLAREIIRGRNWRNLPVVVLVLSYGAGNALFHVEAHLSGIAFDDAGMRLGLAAALMLIALIGGRIIPSFTRNWLSARGARRLPHGFQRADILVLALTALTLLTFVIRPENAVLRWIMLSCGTAHLWRMSRWCGGQVLGEPLLWVLHLAYGFLAFGFLAEGLAQFGLLSIPAARHVWLAGAIGMMTLAVMCRATLGHTGYPLQAGAGTTAIFLSLLVSILLRVISGLPWVPVAALHLSALLWIIGFAGFALLYGPKLLRPRRGKRMPNPPAVAQGS